MQNIPAIEVAAGSEQMATDWLQDTARQASAKALKDAKGQCENASVAFKTLVRTGQPAVTIAQVARDEHVKHIGTRGLGRIQGLLLGSVAMQVVHLAEVPITLIK
jgi:nucleotide-binding universal stress UspA family protein